MARTVSQGAGSEGTRGPVRLESLEHDPAMAPHPRLAAALAAWEAAPKVDGIPLRRSVSPELVPDAVGQIGIVDVLPTGDFRYRLFGSALVAALGYDATGRLTSELDPPEYAELITRQYRAVVTARRPILHEIRTQGSEARMLRYFRLTAPLTLGDGRVDQLWMTVAMLGSFGEEVFNPRVTALFRPRD
ncbi:hypothetical protein GCM10017083_08780 [Thalassobaculum fulvum]|uniref:PAS domain-containing protein n=2 Tax=Thalassobaculum fulvum TaxID=1633335 RepID=A0A918XPT7_9PROT|nr:hypothetical protein GCM10017083_08780 [Thalassobaculum fulvum]